MKAVQLTCNYATNPLGVDTSVPIFNWALRGEGRDEAQNAYRVLVATDVRKLSQDEGDAWDSGETTTDQSCGIRYQGKKLASGRRYWWKVRTRGSDGELSEWSEAAWFETALLSGHEWKAAWIGPPVQKFPPKPNTSDPAPYFRKSVTTTEQPASVRAYVSGLGYYELFLNGVRCGDRVLAPAVSRYDRTVYYETHDLTSLFTTGENVLGVILGNGWYNPNATDAWDFQKAPWRHTPKLLLQLDVTYSDGRKETIASDGSWKVSEGPIVYNDLKNGERYDARLEKQGWNLPGYDDDGWVPAQIIRAPGGLLKSNQMPPIREIREIEAVSVSEPKPGIRVFDFGENISGWGKLRISAAEGTEVFLRYGERLYEDGTLDTREIEQFVRTGEFQTDRYIAKGGASESWQPRFVYHGFQYIQTSGLESVNDPGDIRATVVHTDLPDAGRFECSNPLLNSIQDAARRSTLTNYHGIPTDCPHREKNGWTGDSVLSAEQVLLNFDPVTAYRKWLRDIADAQRPSGQLPGIVPSGGWGYNWGSGPAWDSALILIPWYTYVYASDRRILEQTYESMVKYLGFLDSMASNGILDFGLGDWCPPADGPADHKCPTAVTDTAYAYVDYLTVSRIAILLDRGTDARRFAGVAERIRHAFRDLFVDSSTGSVAGNSQTALACALYQGLVDDDEKPAVLQRLVEAVEQYDRHLDTGILGTKYLLHTLSRYGRTDLAYAIATQTDYPSWGHWIKQGATTLWERWDGSDSRNHHMYSDVSAWFYKELAGLQPDPQQPGFKHTVFSPNPVEDLTWVKAHHNSPYGRVESNWELDSNTFRLHVGIPANCRGSILLPPQFSHDVHVNGVPLSAQDIELDADSGRRRFRVGSGTYEVVGHEQ